MNDAQYAVIMITLLLACGIGQWVFNGVRRAYRRR